jgi:hypothetical protein
LARVGDVLGTGQYAGPGVAPDQIQEGNSKAAVSYCQKIAEETNQIAFLLSGSSGVEWADIFANDGQLVALWRIARQKCLSEAEAERRVTRRRLP